MKLGYDNLEDAKTKLVGTYCLYDKKAIVVKTLEEIEPKKYMCYAQILHNGRHVTFEISDPLFNCSDYNIGYINQYNAAAWFYRVPLKQWKQGLRSDQVKCRASKREFSGVEFKSAKGLSAMLENNYPKLSNVVELLQMGEANVLAFHKDFAMTYDPLHKDYILEYKGNNIGFTHDLKDVKLLDEYAHLKESLKEAMG